MRGIAFLVACIVAVSVGIASASVLLAPVVVHVPGHPSAGGDLTISFRPQRLPHGGYYYAVLVLGQTETLHGSAPACALSSDMAHTSYGYPQANRTMHLTLRPARSADGSWCRTGFYLGAVYAVPHRPPCTSYYECNGKSAEAEGVPPVPPATGVVAPAFQPYSYPGGLPKPIDRTARIVGRFTVRF